MVGVTSKLRKSAMHCQVGSRIYLLYMLLNPFQNLDLVFQTIVVAAAFANLRAGQKAVWTNAVIEVDNNYIHT